MRSGNPRPRRVAIPYVPSDVRRVERTLEHKAFRLDVKDLGDDGTFTGYLSVFGNEDSYGDVVDRGAFTKTLADQGGSFVMLWQHDDTQPIGTMTGVQDERGLFVKAQLNMEVERAREAYALLKQGAIKGLSIGYSAIKWAMNGTTRHLQEIKLYEGSVVTFPANTLATVASVKSLRDDVEAMRAVLDEMKSALGIGVKAGDAPSDMDMESVRAIVDAIKALGADVEPPKGTPEGGRAAELVNEPDDSTREQVKALIAQVRAA